MIYSSERDTMRQHYLTAWEKYQKKQPMEPLERQIAHVIAEHPEYQAFIENKEQALAKDFFPEMGEANPFLHLSLHLGIRDQVNLNNPSGIADIYQQLLIQYGERHPTEHAMMECLAHEMHAMQQESRPFSVDAYLAALRDLLKT